MLLVVPKACDRVVWLSTTRQCWTEKPAIVVSGCTRWAETSTFTYSSRTIFWAEAIDAALSDLSMIQIFFWVGSTMYVVSPPFLPSEYVPGGRIGGRSPAAGCGAGVFAESVGNQSARALPLLLRRIWAIIMTMGFGNWGMFMVVVMIMDSPLPLWPVLVWRWPGGGGARGSP